VIALPDDDDVVAVARKRRDGAVRDVDEGARRLDDRQPQGAGPRERALGRAVGGYHQGRRGDLRDVLGDGDAFCLEGAQDGGIVDEIAENREWAGVGVFEREGDGVAHAETHAQMSRPEDPHTL
jgi:hypothetical protein